MFIYQCMYGFIDDDFYFVFGVELLWINLVYFWCVVEYDIMEVLGIIVVDFKSWYFYFVMCDGMVVCYGVGVGCLGFGWLGVVIIKIKQEWFDWYLLKEMFVCELDFMDQMGELFGGVGMFGGFGNLFGVCVFYFW